jgi:O-antigen ligase
MDRPTSAPVTPHAAGDSGLDRLAALGGALLVALPLAMWIANRSAPLMLALATAAFCAAALTAEGWWPPLRRAAGVVRSPIGLALCAFLLWSLVTLAWSHRPLQGLMAWGELALPLACGVVIAASGRFRPTPALGRALALAIVAAAALMMLELATGLAVRRALDIGRQETFVFNRPVLICLLLAPVALAALRSGRAGGRATDIGLGVLVALVIAWACLGAESGAAGLGLLVMVAVAIIARLAPRLALVAVMVGFAATMALAPVMGRLTDAVLPSSLHQRLANSHSRERVDIWLSFGDAALARPLGGAGFGTSPTLDRHPVAQAVPEQRRAMLAVGHPHNAPLQAWAETGIVGVALLAFAGLAFLHRLRRLPPSELAPRLALFASAFAIAAVAHGAWQGWWIAGLTVAALWLVALSRGTDEPRNALPSGS